MNMTINPLDEERPSRHDLQVAANQTRSRLLQTVDEIDRRRHELTHLAEKARSVVVPAAIAAGVLVAGISGIAAIAWYRHRSSRRVFSLLEAVGRAWNHPERLAAPRKLPWYRELGRKVVLGTLSYVAMEVTKRALPKMLPAPVPEQPLLPQPSVPPPAYLPIDQPSAALPPMRPQA